MRKRRECNQRFGARLAHGAKVPYVQPTRHYSVRSAFAAAAAHLARAAVTAANPTVTATDSVAAAQASIAPANTATCSAPPPVATFAATAAATSVVSIHVFVVLH